MPSAFSYIAEQLGFASTYIASVKNRILATCVISMSKAMAGSGIIAFAFISLLLIAGRRPVVPAEERSVESSKLVCCMPSKSDYFHAANKGSNMNIEFTRSSARRLLQVDVIGLDYERAGANPRHEGGRGRP